MKKRLFKLTSKFLLHPWFRFHRGMTLGARACIFNENKEVLLVKHTYAPGWLFPGGGVERGETIYDAIVREVFEEAGVVVKSENAKLFGFYSNETHFRGDHLAFFVIDNWKQGPWSPDNEIAQAKFFPTDNLPDGATGGTKNRLAEILHNHPKSPHW